MKLLLGFFVLLTVILSPNNVTAQTIVYTDNSPSENFINEEFCYTDFITNSGAPGYGPYIRIEVPPNVTLGSISFQGTVATTTFVGTFTGGLLGDPMLTSGTVADSVAGTTGNDLYVVEFPVGSMVTGGPNFEVEICWTINLTGTIGVAESIFITPVYLYGDTPTGDNGPIIGSVVTESVIPIAYLFTKVSDNFESEATPGACTPVQFTLDLDVANAFTVNNIDITDLFPTGLQYVTMVSAGGCTVVAEPSTVTPGGTLNLDCGNVTGALGSGDRTIIYEAYYTDILDELNCTTIDFFNEATATPSSQPAQMDADTSTIHHAIIEHGNDAGGPVSIGQLVTYSINTEISEYTAGLTAYSLDFVVPDGMIFTPGSIQLGGSPVATANITVLPGPGTGSTINVNVFAEIGATIVPCTVPVLTYTATVSETYASGNPVLSRDPLNNTSNMTYSLTEGAAGCTNPSSSGIIVVDISIAKTINNSPPVGPGRNGQWIPGDIIQYRLEMNIPSQDLDGVVITDFFPLPIHDVTSLAPAFGTDVVFDPSSPWMTPPIGYTLDAPTNSLILDFGDISDGGSGMSVDIIVLIDIVIESVPYADGLYHSNFMGAETDNTANDALVSSVGTLFVVGTPNLTIDKSVVSSDNPSASISSGNISGVDSADTVFFALTATNTGGAQAYDVTFTDAVPAGMSSCELIATDPVTLSGLTPMGFTGGFTGNNLAITLTDSIPFSGNPGGDAAVVNFFCLVDNTNEPQFGLTNQVTTNWTSSPSGIPFPDITDDATITIASLGVNKSIDTIFPTNTNGSDVRIGDNITYSVVVDIPEGGLTNLNFHDELSQGLAFVSIDNIVASPGLTSSLGAFASLIGTEVYSNPGVNPEQEDQIMDLALGDITNTDVDNSITESITITYTTSVLNVGTNNRGDVLGNDFDAIWDDPNGSGTLTESAQAPDVTIAEPELAITKSFLNNTLVPGDETFVTLNVGHVPTSDASAYDVAFSDTLPLGLNYVPGSNALSGSFSATPVVTVAGNIITVDIDSLSTTEDITLTFVVEVDNAFPSCDTIENCSYVAWESLLDASQVGLPVGITNTFVGERTGDVNDIGGANNTHLHQSCASIFTTNGLNTDPNITSTGTVCEGGLVTLSVQNYIGSMVSYEWTGPGIPPGGINSNVVTFNPVSFADTGAYTLVVNVDGCVSDTSQIFNLQIFENPTVSPANNGTLCMATGVDLVLTSNVSGGTGPYTYAWTGPNGFTSQGQDPIIPNPTSANSGMYFVSVTDINGCSNPVASTTVTVSETPAQPNLVSNSPVCEGEDLTITALNYTGNTVTYNWTGPGGPITLNSNVLNLTSVSAADAGNYTLEVVVDGCSSQVTTLAIQVNAPPAPISPLSNSPLCENDTLFLMANNTTGSTYTHDWTGPNSFSSNNENPEIYGVTSAANGGFYTLVVTDSNGCTTQGSLQVTIFDKPETPTVSASNASICAGESTSISSNTAYTGTVLFYIWTGPNGVDTTFVPTLNISPATIADSGLYSLDVEVDGCTSNTSSSVLISVNENTQVPVIISNTPVCEGEDIILSTSTSAASYNWTGPNGFTSNLQSPAAITASALTAGNYNLSTIENGCESVITTEAIIVNATPSAPIITSPSSICDGDDIVLSTNSTCDSYIWSAPSGADPSNPLLNTIAGMTTIPSTDASYAAGDWSVVCVSSDGCESASSTPINVTINAIPTAVVFNDGPICDGGDVTLTGNTVAGSTQTWFDELYTTTLATSAVHTETNLAAGTYTFNYVLNSNGCVDTATTVVTVDPQLAAPTIAVSSNSVCEGEDIILTTSTIADSYAWSGPNGFTSSSQNPIAIVGSTVTAGTYSLVVTQNGCTSAAASETVTVNALPSAPTITGPSSICDGDDLVLTTSSSCDSYLWIGPGGSSTTTLMNPLLNTTANTTTIPSGDAAYAGGDWSVVCVSPDGCESPESTPINITINPIPTAIASNDGPICSDGDVTLTGNTIVGSTQTWFDELYTTTLSTTNVHTEQNLATGTYTFNYVLNSNGCVDTATTVVTVSAVLAPPTIASTSVNVCEGDSFALSTTTAADSYSWTGPNGFTSSVQNPVAINGTAFTAGTYSLTVVISGCGSSTASIAINVNAAPSAPTISGPLLICDGDDLVLSTSSTCDSYLWIGPGGSSTTTLMNPLLNTTTNTTIIPSTDVAYAGGNWSVVCVSPDGCESPESNPITISIQSAPVANATNDGPICDGGDVTLTGNTVAGSTQEWFDELYSTTLSTSSVHTETSLAAGTYTFNYVLNTNGCVDTTSTVVTVSPPVPAPTVSASSTTVCEGEQFILSTSTVADAYMWTGPNGYSSASQAPPAIIGSAATAGTYSLIVTDAGCTSAAGTVIITVNSLPATPVLSASNSVCDGDDISLSTSATATNYHWIAPSGDTVVTAVNNLTVASADVNYGSGDWSLVVENANGCFSSNSNIETITVNPLPVAIATNNGPICANGDATLTGNTQAGAAYQWFDELFTTLLSTSSVHTETNLAPGTYTYNYVVNSNGCVDTATTIVTVNAIDPAPAVAVNNTAVCEGDFFSLSTTTVADSYAWFGPNGYTATTATPVAIQGSSLTAGTYSLVTTTNGCTSDTATIDITVNGLPVTPVLSASNSVCDGDDISLSTSATATNYHWIAPSGDTVVTAVNNLTVTSADVNYGSGDWSLVVENANGCFSSNSNIETITVNPLPVAIATNNGPICANGDATLTGNTQAGATYQWFDELYTTLLSTSSVHTETNLAPGTYTYNYIINSNGCVDTVSTIVTVDPPLVAPVIAVSSNAVCEGDQFILSTSTVADEYAWTGPNGYTSTSVSPPAITGSTATAGTYSLVVTINGCASAAASETVVVNALPSAPTITGPTSLCEGDDLVLSTSSTCDSYLWIGPGGSSASTLSNPLLNTTANTTTIPSTDVAYAGGDWSVICVSPDGCESPQSAPINISIIPVPSNAVAVSNSPVCEGDDILLTTNGLAGATYVWSGTNGFSSVDQNPIISNAQLTDAADYSVTISFMGCSSSISTATTVVVNPIPAAPVPLSNSPVCEGDTIFLYSNTAATSYNWTGPNGFTATTDTAFIPNSNATHNGFYNLTTVVGGCVSPSGQVQVDVVPSSFIPTISSVDNELCVGDVLELNTTGFNGSSAQYIWYGPSGTLDTTFNPTYIDTSVVIADSGEYYVQVLIGTCLSLPSQIELIDVNPVPAMPDIGYTAIVCEEDFIQLTTTTVADSYEWTGPNGYSSTLQNPAVISPASVINTGNYSLSVTLDGCASQDSVVTITVNPKPASPTIFGDSPICVGDSLVVHTTSFADNYQWTAPNGTVTTSPSDSLVIYPVLPADAGTYTLELEVSGCFSDPISITIEIDDSTNAIAYAGEDFYLCNEANVVNLSAEDNGTGFWTTNSDATIISTNDPETLVTDFVPDSTYIFYWTLVSGSCGGTTMDSITVYVPPAPIANTDYVTVIAGQSIDIDVMANDSTYIPGGVAVTIDPLEGLTSQFGNEIEYTADEGAGTSDEFVYELCYEACPEMCDTAFVIVSIDPLLNIPDIITPNGDGSNDAFVIEGIDNYPSHELKIFNRWGNQIFFSDNYQNDWNGIYNGEELPDGTYYYVLVNTEDGELLMNGYITLHR